MVVKEYKAAKERHAEKTRRSHVSPKRHASVLAAIARLAAKKQWFTRVDVYREAGISTKSNDLGTIESLKDAYERAIGRIKGESHD
jgi:hypothetical protein